ncbi:cache domain-containing sensor histidine kinase [Paenibacillus wynnii]|uniref:Histidine kinase n=1 Tax=Paenibacillus wynnii TaxID=268407 RepID=A0A098M4Z8_9BACL|nr:sensor histidine kinase [Paenibacillus wynnii]KGE17634.1 histidine kinase [Paenibacillus wynnii]
MFLIKIITILKQTLFRRTITRTIFLSYLFINILLVFLLGYFSIRDSTATITDQAAASSYKVMEQAAQLFNFNLEEAKRPLVPLAGHYSVIALMKSGWTPGADELIQHERNIADLAYGITAYQSLISDVLILGKNGYVNNVAGRNLLRWDYPFTEQTWFQTAVTEKADKGFKTLGLHKQDYLSSSNVYSYNQYTLSVALPVKAYNGQTIGAVIANLDLDKFNGLFELSAYQDNEDIFMIDDKRTIIVNKHSESIGNKLDFPGIEILSERQSGSLITTIAGKEQLVTYHPTSTPSIRMVSTIPMSEIRAQSDQLRSYLAGIMYLCILFNVLISILITVTISRPFKRLLLTLDTMGEDDLYVVPKNYIYRELNLIGKKFKELVARIEGLVKQNYLSQISMKEAELKSLQSQINPHFLFNTLQALQTEIVCGNTDDSNRLVLSLSNLLRYSMKQSQETVELEQELNNVRDYLFIMNIKYDHAIDIQYEIPDPAVLRSRTVKLMLQPLVENAILHGFKENPQSACIKISVKFVQHGVCVAITDNGAGITEDFRQKLAERLEHSSTDLSSESIGLYNVNQRIKLRFGDPYGIGIESEPGSYTCVYVIVPE